MLESFRKRFSIDDLKWEEIISRFTRVSLPPKTILLKAGEISKKLFIIEKGCIRVWFNRDGKDITFQFFLENNIVSSIESFRENIPSLVTIETIESSVLWWISKRALVELISEIKETATIRDEFINAVFERTYNYMTLVLSLIRDTPTERYQHLLNDHPHIIRRIPQHYIASYLGITSVHLSRIKSKLAKTGI